MNIRTDSSATTETPGASPSPSAEQAAAVLQPALGVLYRRLRQTKVLGDLTLPESSALSQLRHGPATSAHLAKLEQISPQSMGSTIAMLEEKGLVTRAPDPADGRRVILSLSASGRDAVTSKRNRRTQQFTAALEHLSATERAQLITAMPLLERVADQMK